MGPEATLQYSITPLLHSILVRYLLLSSNDRKYLRTVSFSAAGTFSELSSCSAWRR